MDEEKVPMTYVMSKISYESSFLFKILYSIYGLSSIIFIYKILKERPKI